LIVLLAGGLAQQLGGLTGRLAGEAQFFGGDIVMFAQGAVVFRREAGLFGDLALLLGMALSLGGFHPLALGLVEGVGAGLPATLTDNAEVRFAGSRG
jgi:hypothetical protein